LQGFRYRELAGDITQTQVEMAWRTPGPDHPDTPALDLAAALLSDGRGSRLYRGVRERELASQVSAGNHTPRDIGVFTVRAEGDPARARDAARATWVNVMALRESSPSPFEVERVQRLFEARWLRRQETREGQADFLAQWEALGGYERASLYFESVMSLDARAVHNAVVRYLDPDQASVLVYRPRAQAVFEMAPEEVKAQLDTGRSAGFVVQAVMAPDPAPMPARAARVSFESTVGSVSVFRAPSGLPILVRRRLGAPIVNLGFYSAGGASVEPATVAGIGTLMARATIKGTRTRSADVIAAESEMLGGSIGTSVASDGGGWTFSVPNSRWRDAINLLQDVVQHPTLDAAALDTERAIALAQLAQLRDDMFRYPVRLAMEAAFKGHPYGRAVLGSEDSLREITSQEVRRWHEETVLSSMAVLAAVADVPEEEMAQALADAFGEISSAAAVQATVPSWPQSMTQRLETRDKAQTALAIGFPGPTRRDPHRYAVGLLMLIASGLGGRFFDELRDKRSLAYTVQAWATERVQAGMFTAYIATAPAREDEARQALLAEFAKLREYPVTPEELTRATRYALGSHAIAQQSGATVLGEMIDAWLFGEGLEELDLFESRILAVTADDIQRFAMSSFDLERRVEGIVRGK
jgi:zinc protease